MTTKNPRINIVLEKPLYQSVEQLAQKNDLSLSSQVRDLIMDALETYEDKYWSKKADERIKTNKKDYLSHDLFWKKALNGK